MVEHEKDKNELDNRNYFALFAGLSASAASFFGKLSGGLEESSFTLNIWLVRAICIGLMIVCNAMVWTFFVKALHSHDGSTLKATVTSAATNYFVSYILGILVFREKITIFTVLGTSLILIGLLLIVRDETSSKTSTKNEKTK